MSPPPNLSSLGAGFCSRRTVWHIKGVIYVDGKMADYVSCKNTPRVNQQFIKLTICEKVSYDHQIMNAFMLAIVKLCMILKYIHIAHTCLRAVRNPPKPLNL